MKRVILDTNFLLIPSQFNVDIFTEIERIADFPHKVYVIDKTIDELNKIKKNKNQKTRNRDAAKLGLQLLESKNIEIIKTEDGFADDILVDIADKDNIIATQDSELRKRIKAKNIPLIVLRSKKHLILA